MDFENKKYDGVHASRFIASFINAMDLNVEFGQYLGRLQKDGVNITDDELNKIFLFGVTGKKEFENPKYVKKVKV